MIWSAVIARILPSFTLRVYGQNLARLAFHGNAKWPATHLAICRELLVPHRRIHNDAVLLPAVRAHQFFSVLHYSLYFEFRIAAMHPQSTHMDGDGSYREVCAKLLEDPKAP